MVQTEVLYKTWDLDQSQLAFVRTLRDLEANEMRGTDSPAPRAKPNIQTVNHSRGTGGKELGVFHSVPLKTYNRVDLVK